MPATWTVKPITAEWTSKTETGKSTGTTVYQAIASEPSNPYDAERATGIPGIGSNYPGASGTMRCVSRDASADPTRTIFRVRCDYDSTITLNANPLNDPQTFDYGGEDSDESYFKDTSTPAKYAQTTAYEPFAELPKRASSIVTIEFSRNVAATATFATYFPYANKVNDGTVAIDGMTYADGQVKVGCPKLSAIKNRDGTDYKVLSVTLKARGDGWDQKFESRGLYELDSGYSFPIADNNGNPVETPWPLDSNGAKKANASDAGAEIVLKPYQRTSLTGLFT